MPRSIKQFKHRLIQFEKIDPEQLAQAVRILGRLPGVLARGDAQTLTIAVEYWVDEYLYAELEGELLKREFLLADDTQQRILRNRIQQEEALEREGTENQSRMCRSGGVFAQTYHARHDDSEALPYV